MVKPDLCNIDPADLDEDTLRNMHAIGVDFAMREVNRLKAFESKTSHSRKWKSYFDSERNSNKKSKIESTSQQDDKILYEATSTNKDKILQRCLAAWPTPDQTSGIGNEPGKIVGTTMSQLVDQSSCLNQKDKGSSVNIAGLPTKIKNLKKPGVAKSAAGSTRSKVNWIRTMID